MQFIVHRIRSIADFCPYHYDIEPTCIILILCTFPSFFHSLWIQIIKWRMLTHYLLEAFHPYPLQLQHLDRFH